MEQLFFHLIGDYITQNDWMALKKKKAGIAGFSICLLHCTIYALPFLFIGSIYAFCVILISHFILDRTHIVEWYLAARNGVDNIDNFGFSKERPFAITIWLMIITDNIFHLMINFIALKYL